MGLCFPFSQPDLLAIICFTCIPVRLIKYFCGYGLRDGAGIQLGPYLPFWPDFLLCPQRHSPWCSQSPQYSQVFVPLDGLFSLPIQFISPSPSTGFLFVFLGLKANIVTSAEPSLTPRLRDSVPTLCTRIPSHIPQSLSTLL